MRLASRDGEGLSAAIRCDGAAIKDAVRVRSEVHLRRVAAAAVVDAVERNWAVLTLGVRPRIAARALAPAVLNGDSGGVALTVVCDRAERLRVRRRDHHQGDEDQCCH
ncbi:MAG: hypothetical protein Q8J97_11215 [Flavobacteriaceae bacterium]|nr:hypothetical protein [Flavobacteriaceae bacterium]